MPYPIKKQAQKYTYGDYLTWPDDERWELIDGEAYNMTPAPSRFHQDILRELFLQFAEYLKDKTCKVYCAPFDVRLPDKNEKDEEIETVVQPDIVVICDKSKLDDKGCIGAPDLIIEIVSPYTVQKDLKEKFSLYEKKGVKQYWIVYPDDKMVMVFNLGKNKEYGKPKIYSKEDKIEVGIFRSFVIDLKMIFNK
ncbi:MAG: Uma2 family endonuclease [Candidatus Firestonebacteria bacterium]|nr:Uma2 family endonuclease [Candidatus Firestonebacteria bacterium]